MITLPLLSQGVDIYGIDRSKESIAYGRDVFSRYGFDADRLLDGDLAEIHQQFDIIVASKVLEHVCDDELPRVLALLRERLKDDGKLLVTVPNGFGLFELDSLLYFKMGLGRLAERIRLTRALERLKARIQGREYLIARTYRPLMHRPICSASLTLPSKQSWKRTDLRFWSAKARHWPAGPSAICCSAVMSGSWS